MVGIEDIRKIKDKYSFELLGKSLVSGVGIGPKIINGENTGELCIRVYVTYKIDDKHVDEEHKIPEKIEGVKTDVVEGEVLEKSATSNVPTTAQSRVRPAQPGCSISHYATATRGTLGALALDKETDELLFMSNWHVIANFGMCRRGDPILQPGGLDGGTLPDDIIGYLERWEDVQMLCPARSNREDTLSEAKQRIRKAVEHDIDLPVNYVDAAVAKPVSDDAVIPTPLGTEEIKEADSRDTGNYRPQETKKAKRGEKLVKSGATTGVTSATVVDTDYDTLIKYSDVGIALFKDQILTNGFAVMNPMSKVSSSLQVDLLRLPIE